MAIFGMSQEELWQYRDALVAILWRDFSISWSNDSNLPLMEEIVYLMSVYATAAEN